MTFLSPFAILPSKVVAKAMCYKGNRGKLGAVPMTGGDVSMKGSGDGKSHVVKSYMSCVKR